RIGLRPWTDLLIPRTRILVGGALGALRDALGGHGVAANMAGGTHHAHRDWGSGFCVFNDLAVCARAAQREFGVGKVVVLDFDVHQGDGTATIFANDPSVFTLSVHCEANFPFLKAASDVDIELPVGADDEQYLRAVDRALEVGLNQQPELVLFQAGVDPLAADRLGRMSISREGLKERNRRVLTAAVDERVPCSVFMGGGYCDPIDPTVEAFVDLFECAADHHEAAQTRQTRDSRDDA
ncbi:MAG: histone deacetylase, partial [Myxococcales bacterium]|nr:histone deacetylase [Myxococcales bacterium]